MTYLIKIIHRIIYGVHYYIYHHNQSKSGSDPVLFYYLRVVLCRHVITNLVILFQS